MIKGLGLPQTLSSSFLHSRVSSMSTVSPPIATIGAYPRGMKMAEKRNYVVVLVRYFSTDRQVCY